MEAARWNKQGFLAWQRRVTMAKAAGWRTGKAMYWIPHFEHLLSSPKTRAQFSANINRGGGLLRPLRYA